MVTCHAKANVRLGKPTRKYQLRRSGPVSNRLKCRHKAIPVQRCPAGERYMKSQKKRSNQHPERETREDSGKDAA